MPYRSWCLRGLLLNFLLASPLALAQATYRFDLPEQPLADSLRAIAAQTGTNILFDSRDVKDIRVAALHAALTLNQAIERTLRGTRLAAESPTPTTIIIRLQRTGRCLYRCSAEGQVGINRPS